MKENYYLRVGGKVHKNNAGFVLKAAWPKQSRDHRRLDRLRIVQDTVLTPISTVIRIRANIHNKDAACF